MLNVDKGRALGLTMGMTDGILFESLSMYMYIHMHDPIRLGLRVCNLPSLTLNPFYSGEQFKASWRDNGPL